METLKDKIKRIRKKKRLSQDELAKLAGITRVSYTYFENGTTNKLSVDAAIGICKALEIPFTELFDIDNIKTKELEIELTSLKKILQKKDEEIMRLKLENAFLQDTSLSRMKTEFTLSQSLNEWQVKASKSTALLLLLESFQFIDIELFTRSFSDLVGNKKPIKTFDIQVIEDLYYLIQNEIEVILNYVDLSKHRNDLNLKRLVSKFNLQLSFNDIVEKIEVFQKTLKENL